MTSMRYIALLRGINVGGNKKIKMADLRTMLEGLGFSNVKTVLASGNVAWDADHSDTDAMQKSVEDAIHATFGFAVPIIVFPAQYIQTLIESDPFAGIEVTKETRLYVTFLPQPTPTTLNMPYDAPTGDFRILAVNDYTVCSVLTVTKTKTVDGMKILETEFGRQITTRNWNTVIKLANL